MSKKLDFRALSCRVDTRVAPCQRHVKPTNLTAPHSPYLTYLTRRHCRLNRSSRSKISPPRTRLSMRRHTGLKPSEKVLQLSAPLSPLIPNSLPYHITGDCAYCLPIRSILPCMYMYVYIHMYIHFYHYICMYDRLARTKLVARVD